MNRIALSLAIFAVAAYAQDGAPSVPQVPQIPPLPPLPLPPQQAQPPMQAPAPIDPNNPIAQPLPPQQPVPPQPASIPAGLDSNLVSFQSVPSPTLPSIPSPTLPLPTLSVPTLPPSRVTKPIKPSSGISTDVEESVNSRIRTDISDISDRSRETGISDNEFGSDYSDETEIRPDDGGAAAIIIGANAFGAALAVAALFASSYV